MEEEAEWEAGKINSRNNSYEMEKKRSRGRKEEDDQKKMVMMIRIKINKSTVDDENMMKKKNFCKKHVRDPCRSFGRRCSLLVKEQRARFYILRRCVTMLLCWHECGDP